MIMTVRVLGLELLHFEITTDPTEEGEERGDVVTTLTGFAPPAAIPVHEPGTDHG